MRAFLSIVLMMISTASFADCYCACVDGDVQALCSSSLDIEPICPPRICPIDTPSIKPIRPQQIPPIGTSDCDEQRVLNPLTGRYDWETVCQ